MIKGAYSKWAVLIQLACYARVLFSSCTVNFREPIDLLRKQLDIVESVEAAVRAKASLYVQWAKSLAKAVVVRAKVI